MARKEISRNDPCPCGSGKKFKHCCIGKDIDWRARQAAGTKMPLPFAAPKHEDEEDGDDDALDRQTLAVLRRHHVDDLADLYANDRLEYDRRYERVRQFFFGPPDEELAGYLRRKGVID